MGLLRLPLTLLLVGLAAVPIAILATYSIFTQGPALEPVPEVTKSNYDAVLRSPLLHTIVVNTLAIAVPTTFAATVGGFALAYFIAFRAKRTKGLLLAAVVVCYMGSFLAYIYSWRTISGQQGLANSLLEKLGLIDRPLEWILFSRFAVVVAETQFFLPFTTLVIFSSLAGLPANVVLAARDLGAPAWQATKRIVVPLAGRATFGAATFVLFLSAGDYVTPVFLGGALHGSTIGTAIADAISTGLNYPLGAATGFVMMTGLAMLAGVAWVTMRACRLLPRPPR
jgi:ABC-type spermidine/putrescine transport system permease subunit I